VFRNRVVALYTYVYTKFLSRRCGISENNRTLFDGPWLHGELPRRRSTFVRNSSMSAFPSKRRTNTVLRRDVRRSLTKNREPNAFPYFLFVKYAELVSRIVSKRTQTVPGERFINRRRLIKNDR